MKTIIGTVSAVQEPAASGPGGCCVEAQADGVPCSEIRECEQCGRARPMVVATAASSAAIQH